jgi:hypothetical protein
MKTDPFVLTLRLSVKASGSFQNSHPGGSPMWWNLTQPLNSFLCHSELRSGALWVHSWPLFSLSGPHNICLEWPRVFGDCMFTLEHSRPVPQSPKTPSPLPSASSCFPHGNVCPSVMEVSVRADFNSLPLVPMEVETSYWPSLREDVLWRVGVCTLVLQYRQGWLLMSSPWWPSLRACQAWPLPEPGPADHYKDSIWTTTWTLTSSISKLTCQGLIPSGYGLTT